MMLFYSFLFKLRVFGLPEKEHILLACRKLNLLFYGVYVQKDQKDQKDQNLENPSKIAQKNEKHLIDIAELLPIETTYMTKD